MFKFLDFKNRINESRGDIPALEAALAEARKVHAETLAELQQIAARRTDYLLSDRDEDLDRDDKRASVLHRILEKAKASIPEVERRLGEARAAAHSGLVGNWQAKANASFQKCRTAFLAAIEAYEQDQRLRREIERQYGSTFAAEVKQADPFLRGMDMAGVFKSWLTDAEMRLGISRPAPVKAAPKPHGTNGAKAAPRRRPLYNAEYTQSPPKPPRQVILEHPEEGFRSVTVVRGGFEYAGRAHYPGDVINMTPKEADQALRGGAVDIAPVAGQEVHR
jgi:hypothetical protein